MSIDEDRRLVAAALSGDDRATSALFEHHWPDAWRLARSVTGSDAAADDAAQEGFIKAIHGLAHFRGDATFRSWLHRIIYNAALDHLRADRRNVPRAWPRDEQHAAAPKDDSLDAVFLLLEAVSPERRAALVLHHCLHYSLAEVAEILGVPIGTVQSRTSRGLAQLRTHLEVSEGG